MATSINGDVDVVVGEFEETLATLERRQPRVVVNTIGPFTETAKRVIESLPGGTHYVDVGNELGATRDVLAASDRAVASGQTLVASGGFGVLATESLVLHLLQERAGPQRVRVDAMGSVALEAGRVGEALAKTIVGGIHDGAWRVSGGTLVRARLGSGAETFATPEGDRVSSACFPSGDLLAAWNASGADEVLAASSLAPRGLGAALVPMFAWITRVGPLRRAIIRRIARAEFQARPAPFAHSWARARMEWASGERREGWLRAGDAMSFTVAALCEITRRLYEGEATPGASTPGALFGPSLAEAAGGEFLRTVEAPAAEPT